MLPPYVPNTEAGGGLLLASDGGYGGASAADKWRRLLIAGMDSDPG